MPKFILIFSPHVCANEKAHIHNTQKVPSRNEMKREEKPEIDIENIIINSPRYFILNSVFQQKYNKTFVQFRLIVDVHVYKNASPLDPVDSYTISKLTFYGNKVFRLFEIFRILISLL